MKYISLFAGIGGFDLALTRLGHECVFANEWDKYASSIYEKHFGSRGNTEELGTNDESKSSSNRSNGERGRTCSIDTRDLRTITTNEIPDHELLVGGFPCQAFSIAGKRRGFDDTRGTLFFEIARILKDKQPKYFILENVKGLLSHDSGNTFKTIISTLTDLRYDLQWQVLNSKNFGVPQNRERVFIIGNLRGEPRPEVFPIGESSGLPTESIKQGETKGGISTAITSNYKRGVHSGGETYAIQQVNQPKHSNDRVYNVGGISPTLNTMQGGNRQPFIALTERRTEEAKLLRRKGIVKDTRSLKKLTPRDDGLSNTVTTGDTKNHSLTDGARIRRLTPVECERLQGFPDNWTEYGVDDKGNKVKISDSQRYKVLGNAVTVNVVEYIISKFGGF